MTFPVVADWAEATAMDKEMAHIKNAPRIRK
jgi:hypothetical protein